MNSTLAAKAVTISLIRMSSVLLKILSLSVAVSEVRAFARFGGLLHDVQPRLPGVTNRASRAVGMELEDQILAGIVTRPGRQCRAIRIACPGEVDPVALRHARDCPILVCCWRWRRSKAPGTQGAEYERNFAAVGCSGPQPFPHAGLNVGEPVEVNGRAVGSELAG